MIEPLRCADRTDCKVPTISESYIISRSRIDQSGLFATPVKREKMSEKMECTGERYPASARVDIENVVVSCFGKF